MKKVIGGSLYNTETARQLAAYESRAEQDQGDYYCETLYLTKSGKYFLHGKGGTSTVYATKTDGPGYKVFMEPGEAIRPLSFIEARRWAEEMLDAEEYLQVFPIEDEEGAGKVPLNLSVSTACRNKLFKMREKQGNSISVIVEKLVMEDKGGTEA